MDEFYLACNDKCFKCIFQNPQNQYLLGLLIESVTGYKYSNMNYSNVEKNVNVYIKRKYLDMNLDSKDAIVNIEMNRFNRNYIRPRNTSFICDCYSNNVLTNGKYTEDKDVIQINFSYGIKGNVPIKKYMILNTNRNDQKPRVKNFKIYEVNMDYIMKYWYNRNKQDVNLKIIEYRYFIMLSLNLNELEELYEITQDERIRDFMKELERVNTLPEFRQFITEEQDKEFILNTVRHEGEKIGEARGQRIGEARGQRIGEARGQRIGEARGEKKGALKSKLETARNMLKDKVNINTISKYTGLSLSQIKNISL